jgi:hypothetical protein
VVVQVELRLTCGRQFDNALAVAANILRQKIVAIIILCQEAAIDDAVGDVSGVVEGAKTPSWQMTQFTAPGLCMPPRCNPLRQQCRFAGWSIESVSEN